MATNKEITIPKDKLVLYEMLIAKKGRIELKGVTMPYTSWNGHMFSFLDGDGNLGLRLSKEDREIFILAHNSRLCEAHGTVLKEYVLVPEKLFRNTDKVIEYFNLSFGYFSSLKPKISRKK